MRHSDEMPLCRVPLSRLQLSAMKAAMPQSAVVRLVVSMIAGTALGTAVGIMLTDAELGVLAGLAATGAIFSAAGWICCGRWMPIKLTTMPTARRSDQLWRNS